MSATQTAPTTEPTATQAKAPQPGDVTRAYAEQSARDEKRIAELEERVRQLQANAKPELAKLPVSDKDLEAAIVKLEAYNKGQLREPSPKLNLSLSGELGFQPILTAPQKAVWGPRRDAMRSAHSAHWKSKSAEVMGHLRRAVRTPHAIMRGGITTRKTDGKVNAVSLAARNLAPKAKVKGKGKGAAKPANPVAPMPKAPTAANPATVK